MIHCEWNSTLESIVEGVPLICRPFSKRAEDKRGILTLESTYMRALALKEKLKASQRSGDSSYHALDDAELHAFVKTIIILSYMYHT
ncbi:hypothetical protein IGI04_034026 [Brassica rapa subsp. trilocularis]|uniref:Uncharacterized protein n=1 Tax=Brassica rapa subsp. trilocularis TaxID=1813537 RepID=A0ABQ7L9S2_BRACM|nr:hypothetical protein IGI04_034026 [Brassica rapa subsp. trilocularis]